MLNNSGVEFYVPDSSLITIENIVIPQSTTNDELIYKFLNFIYRKVENMFKGSFVAIITPFKNGKIDEKKL